MPLTDDMIVADNSKRGLGWKEITAAGAVGLAGLGLWKLGDDQAAAPSTIEPAAAQVQIYYDDPESGLTPLPGAATPAGSQIKGNP